MSAFGDFFSFSYMRQCQPQVVRESVHMSEERAIAHESEDIQPTTSSAPMAAMQRAASHLSAATSGAAFGCRRPSAAGLEQQTLLGAAALPCLKPDEAVVRANAAAAGRSQLPPVHTTTAQLGREAHQDPQRASEYVDDVLRRLRQVEQAIAPRADYMDTQVEINSKMRGILVDWLIEVHMKYNMQWETIFLAVHIIDRYLSLRMVQRKKLQLLGVVALFIAAKYEEIDPPRAQEFATITDNTYSKKDVVQMEARVLSALDFKVTAATPAHFFEEMQRANEGGDEVQCATARYLLELSLLDLKSLCYPPSLLVASALFLSNELIRRRSPAWSATLAQRCNRSEAELKACTSDLRSMLQAAGQSKLQVVQRKYKLEKNHAVANVVARKGSKE